MRFLIHFHGLMHGQFAAAVARARVLADGLDPPAVDRVAGVADAVWLALGTADIPVARGELMRLQLGLPIPTH